MAHIIEGAAAPGEHALLANMFVERKRVFIDLLHWDVPVLDGRFEVDQFDGPTTVYLIIAGPDGSHLGSMRLLPSDGPNILGSIFPCLCEDAPPSSPDIWEISRFCLSRSLKASERRVIRDELVTAAVSFALANRIRAFCCVAETAWLSQILAFGWRCLPLGLPVRLNCGWTGALQIEVSEDTPSLMAAAGTWHPTPMQFADQADAFTS